MPEKLQPLAFGVVLCLLGTIAGAQQSTPDWPLISAAESRATFVDPGKDGADTPFRLLINDTKGRPAYRFECHNGNYEQSSEITYSGDFHCVLLALLNGKKNSSNLLADSTPAQQRSDWFNRGRMMAAQLRGDCAGSPYGTTRVFRLRGMRLTLRFTNIRWAGSGGETQLEEFTVIAIAASDPTARTTTAAIVPVQKAIADSCS